MALMYEANEYVDPAIRSLINAMAWRAFNAYRDKKIISKRIIFFTLSLYVRDLRSFWEAFFGPEPV